VVVCTHSLVEMSFCHLTVMVRVTGLEGFSRVSRITVMFSDKVRVRVRARVRVWMLLYQLHERSCSWSIYN